MADPWVDRAAAQARDMKGLNKGNKQIITKEKKRFFSMKRLLQ